MRVTDKGAEEYSCNICAALQHHRTWNKTKASIKSHLSGPRHKKSVELGGIRDLQRRTADFEARQEALQTNALLLYPLPPARKAPPRPRMASDLRAVWNDHLQDLNFSAGQEIMEHLEDHEGPDYVQADLFIGREHGDIADDYNDTLQSVAEYVTAQGKLPNISGFIPLGILVKNHLLERIRGVADMIMPPPPDSEYYPYPNKTVSTSPNHTGVLAGLIYFAGVLARST